MNVFISVYILFLFVNSFHSVHKLGYDVMCIQLSRCIICETTERTGVSLIADQSTAALLHRKPAFAVPFHNSHCAQDSNTRYPMYRVICAKSCLDEFIYLGCEALMAQRIKM
jgi:hypothetical protein